MLGGAVGVVAGTVGYYLVKASYSTAKSKLTTIPSVSDMDVFFEAERTSSRQHVVFLVVNAIRSLCCRCFASACARVCVC